MRSPIIAYGTHAATSAPITHSSYPTRAIVGWVLIGLVVSGWTLFFVLRARKRRMSRTVSPPPMALRRGPTMFPSTNRQSPPPREVGWHFDPDDMSAQAYWDGRSWTARRRWSGESWIDAEENPPG